MTEESRTKYQLLHTTRNYDSVCRELSVVTKIEYEGTDRAVVENVFCNEESLGLDESYILYVLTEKDGQDVIVRSYERTK